MSTAALPQLPAESIHKIILLSLLPPSIATDRERHVVLKRLAHVNKTWGGMAVYELYTHAIIAKSSAVKQLSAVLRKTPLLAARVQSIVLDLRKGGAWPAGLMEVYTLLCMATRVEQLWMFRSQQRKIDLFKLSYCAPRLELLCIDNLAPCIYTTTPCPSFPHLVTLALADVDSVDLFTSAFAASLPQLRQLTLAAIGAASGLLQSMEMKTILKTPTPMLENFTFVDFVDLSSKTPRPVDWWDSMSSLQSPTLTSIPHESSPLHAIPSSVGISRAHRPAPNALRT